MKHRGTTIFADMALALFVGVFLARCPLAYARPGAQFGGHATSVRLDEKGDQQVAKSLFDENAEILNNMAKKGSDLRPPRPVDFSLVFPNRASADAFAAEVGQEGFKIAVHELDRNDDPWDVTASMVMVPSAENITSTEERLGALARAQGGRADGWGFYRV